MTGSNPFGTWITFDLAANGVAIKSLTFSYSSASRLDFYVTAPEQSTPIPRMAWIKLWDDVGTDDNNQPLTATNPLFYGIVANITPGAHSNQVLYVVMDPTYFAAKSVAVMSLPYQAQTDQQSVPASGAVPRLVYNVKNTADDDYGYEVGQNLTVGQIVAGIFNYTFNPLYWLGCGGVSGSSAAYDPTDLPYMNFVPQEKMVWESITMRAAVEQLWRCEPRFRMFFHPATQLWRFYMLNNPYPGTTGYPAAANPSVTLTLNDSSIAHPTGYPLIGLEVNPAFEDCATAVSIYGPANVGAASFYWDSTLTTLNNTNLQPVGSPVVLEHYSDTHGMQTAQTYTTWQIFDPTQRAGSRILNAWQLVPTDQFSSSSSRFPVFMASWDLGTTWQACKGVWIDFLNGTATFQNGLVPWRSITDNGQPAIFGTTQTIFPPNAFKLVWAPYLPPLEVRFPATGFYGTAYTLYGCKTEYRLYDESLAIGREYGTPVTSATRLAQYVTLAQYLQQTRCDVIYTGQACLAGCDYQYCRLNRQVNVSDAAGATTGWESMFAIVTDVEYTYGDQPSTTLTFNGNWQELYGEDPATLRARLRIQSFNQYTYAQVFGSPIVTYGYQTIENYDGSHSQQVTSMNVNNPFVYIDQYGHRETAGIS